MKEALLTILRDKETQTAAFRSATNRLADLIAADAALQVSLKNKTVHTPLASCNGKTLKYPIVLVPILRAGLALLPSFLKIFPTAAVGFMGVKRDEETAKPHQYYENFPEFSGDEEILVLDPMIATGGSAILTLRRLIHYGAKQKNIRLYGIIAANEGILSIRHEFPDIELQVVAQDTELNAAHFIVPGLGDFGDRYFSC